MHMKAKIILVIAFLSLLFVSCGSEENLNSYSDGLWKDNIHLSEKEIILGSQKSSKEITTIGKKWWITCVRTDNNTVFPEYETADYSTANISIEGEWFTIEKNKSDVLTINIDTNTSKVLRNLVITLQSGNYFDRISIAQKSKE